MSEPARRKHIPPPLVALAAWIVPGLGYLLIRQWARGLTIGLTILLLFVFGIFVGGIRVVDVPGYTNLGSRIMLDRDGNRVEGYRAADASWALRAYPLRTVLEKPWFVGQVLAGSICIVAAKISIDVAKPVTSGSVVSIAPTSHARSWEIGTLYTAVAGMLNLMAIIDAAHRAGRQA